MIYDQYAPKIQVTMFLLGNYCYFNIVTLANCTILIMITSDLLVQRMEIVFWLAPCKVFVFKTM